MASKTVNYGGYAFLGGLVIALVLGLLSSYLPAGVEPILKAVLFVLGLVVGLLNVSDKEMMLFLVAAVAMLAASLAFESSLVESLALVPGVGEMVGKMVSGFVGAFQAFISPAAFIVAIQAVYKIAQPD
ncbi:MAG: hypothetical protein AB1324_02690 [Candidatus Micrarchaeota archaeon]